MTLDVYIRNIIQHSDGFLLKTPKDKKKYLKDMNSNLSTVCSSRQLSEEILCG